MTDQKRTIRMIMDEGTQILTDLFELNGPMQISKDAILCLGEHSGEYAIEGLDYERPEQFLLLTSIDEVLGCNVTIIDEENVGNMIMLCKAYDSEFVGVDYSDDFPRSGHTALQMIDAMQAVLNKDNDDEPPACKDDRDEILNFASEFTSFSKH